MNPVLGTTYAETEQITDFFFKKKTEKIKLQGHDVIR